MTLRVESGTAIVSMSGDLGRSALCVCRSALDAAIRLRPTQLIVDLDQARTDPDAAGLLTLMIRAAARHGLFLHLAGASIPVQTQLATLAPTACYQAYQSMPVALRALTGVARPAVS